MASTDGKETFTTTISLERGLYERFRVIAERNHRKPRQQVRHLIAEYVKRESEKAAA